MNEVPHDESSAHNLIDELADDFLCRLQAGESPSVAEYCQLHPDLAGQIHELFPTLMMLEDAKSSTREERRLSAPPPEKIGGYRVVRRIGQGGMGVVYEAHHEDLDRPVALKVLSQRLADDQRALVRFQREGRAIANLHHTNIVPLYEVGTESGYFFLAMQLIVGRSLDKVILAMRGENAEDSCAAQLVDPSPSESTDSPPSTIDIIKSRQRDAAAKPGTTRRRCESRYLEIARLGWQAADAISYAHQRGVIHRDIKPSNLILDDQGMIWLTDFGLAKTDDEELTQTGEFLGTLRYMAPERFRGVCAAHADIYSLGITLYELIALRPAFEASDRLRLIDEIANIQPPRLSTVAPGIPRDLATIVHKAIDKVPSSRYPTAAELADDLKRFLDDQPIHARRNPPLELLARWGRRNRGLAASLAALAMLLVLVAVGSTVGIVREARLRSQAMDAGVEAQRAQAIAEARGDQLRRTLYFAEMNLAGQAANAPGGTRQIFSVTQHWRPTAASIDQRGWEWFYLRSLCMNEGLVLPSAPHSSSEMHGSWSPDGTRVALVHEHVGMSIWHAESGERLRFWDHIRCRAVAWSPDGSQLATGGTDNRLTIRDASTGDEIGSFVTGQRIDVIAWHPAGLQVACGAGDRLYVSSSSQLSDVTEIVGGTDLINVLQWSPDGRQIACGNWWGQQLRICDVENGRVVQDLPARFVKWASDGQTISQWLTSDDAGTIFVWDAASGNRIERLVGHYGEVRSLAWSHKGTHLASASSDRTCRVWDVAMGRCVRSFHGHADEVYDVQWSPDDERLVSSSIEGSARIWRPADDVRLVLSGHRERVRSVRWNSQGTALASASSDGAIRIWRLPGGEQQQVLKGHETWVHAVGWSPDGTQLASGGADGVIIWDASSGRKLQHLCEPPTEVLELDWSPDGLYLATIGTGSTIHIWQTSTGQIAQRLEGHVPFGHTVRWSPQGDRLASAGADEEIKIWDAQTFQLLQRLNGHQDDVVGVAWRHDGQQLVSGSRDESVKTWDLTTGANIGTYMGHHGAVWSVSWSPDGSRIVSGSRDGSVKLWDPTSGKQALTLRDSTGGVWCVAWSSTGQRLAAGDSGGTVAIWDAGPAFEELDGLVTGAPSPAGTP